MKRIGRSFVYWYRTFQWEALLWFAGLTFLACSNPYDPAHRNLFPPAWLLGLRSPGYNLGHAIAFLFRGRIVESLQANPLGIIAVVILAYRIASLIHASYLKYKQEEGATHVPEPE